MRSPMLRCLVIFLLLAGFTPASASVPAQGDLQNPYRVRDINPHTSDGSKISAWMEAGLVSYFFASGGRSAPGLWKTDGTPGGTAFVKEIAPAGYETENITPISGMLGGFLYFCAGNAKLPAGDLEHGAELWRTDGTNDGTQMVADLTPGSDGSYPHSFTALGGKLYFLTGVVLWRLDAPDQPPVPVWGGTNQMRVYAPLVVLGDRLYFAGADPEHGTELWVSDGTPQGTTLQDDLNEGQASSSAVPLLANNGDLYFRATDGKTGLELWVLDTALSTIYLVHDIASGLPSSNPWYLQAMGDDVFFQACDTTYGCELYRTDGKGATRLTDLFPGSEGSDPIPVGVVDSGASQGMLFIARAYSPASAPASGPVYGVDWNVYRSDGTPGGEVLLVDRAIQQGSFFQGSFYIAANDLVHGQELWQTDGTLPGTRLLADLLPGERGSSPTSLGLCGSRLCFAADDGDHGSELWSTGGDPANTALVADLNTDVPGSHPGGFTGAGDLVYFLASDGTHPGSLWRTDGSADGTWLLVPGPQNHHLTAVGSTLFFDRYDATSGQELWRTDGTPESTRMVKEIFPGPVGAAPDDLTAYQGRLFFSAYDPTHGKELWQTDGTEAGTGMVADLTPGPLSTSIANLLVLEGQLIFTAAGDLWRSDGTAAGTQAFADINPLPIGFVAANRRLFFTSQVVYPDMKRLWQTDATREGTLSIAAPACLGQYHDLNGPTSMNDAIYFTDTDWETRTLTLARTRGAEFGVECVWSKQLAGIFVERSERHMVAYAGKIIFDTPGPSETREIWVSDGTAAGTRLFPDQASSTSAMYPAGPFLYFSGQADASGRELWVWDGSDAQPRLVADILPGAESSYPGSFYAWRHRLVFSASDGVAPGVGHGAELWAYDIPVLPVYLPVVFR